MLQLAGSLQDLILQTVFVSLDLGQIGCHMLHALVGNRIPLVQILRDAVSSAVPHLPPQL